MSETNSWAPLSSGTSNGTERQTYGAATWQIKKFKLSQKLLVLFYREAKESILHFHLEQLCNFFSTLHNSNHKLQQIVSNCRNNNSPFFCLFLSLVFGQIHVHCMVLYWSLWLMYYPVLCGTTPKRGPWTTLYPKIILFLTVTASQEDLYCHHRHIQCPEQSAIKQCFPWTQGARYISNVHSADRT